MRHDAALALLVLLASACDGASGLVVDLRTDLAAGAELDEVEVLVFSGSERSGDPTRRAVTALPFGADATRGVRVAELEALPPGSYLIVARLTRSGVLVAEGTLLASVDGPQVVTVLVTRDCVGVSCEEEGGALLACRNGACEDARCGPEHPELCTEACTIDADCATGAPACVAETCFEGGCFSRPDDGACPGRCDATRGCVSDGAPFPTPTPGGDATYYVAVDGDDANDGSLAAPWATLTYASSQVGAGDVVEVLDGVYEELVVIGATGTPEAPIVFRSSSGGAVIDGTNVTSMSDPFSVLLFGGAHVTLHGFEIHAAPSHCIRVNQVDGVTLTGLHIHDCGSSAIGASFAADLRVVGCDLHDLNGGVTASPVGDRTVVEGNHIRDVMTSAVYTECGQPDVDAGGDGTGSDVVIARNLMERTGAGGGAALNLAGLTGARILNNVSRGGLAAGITLFATMGGPVADSLVAHNTLVFATGEGRAAVGLRGAFGNDIVNNVLVAGQYTAYDVDTASVGANRFDHNVVFSRDRPQVAQIDALPLEDPATWRARGVDASSVFDEPLLGPDLRLLQGSAGAGIAEPRAEVPADYRGAPRDAQGSDPGAFAGGG